MKLTKEERQRIARIRFATKQFKEAGLDVSTWEATFFLLIVDRLLRAK